MWENLLVCVNFFFFFFNFNFYFYDHGKILWVCAWIYLWVLANFVGIVEKFCWVCENLFVHEVVGIFSWHAEIFFLHGYGKIWQLYGYVINLVVETFWWGIDLILWWGVDLIL